MRKEFKITSKICFEFYDMIYTMGCSHTLSKSKFHRIMSPFFMINWETPIESEKHNLSEEHGY